MPQSQQLQGVTGTPVPQVPGARPAPPSPQGGCHMTQGPGWAAEGWWPSEAPQLRAPLQGAELRGRGWPRGSLGRPSLSLGGGHGPGKGCVLPAADDRRVCSHP